MVNTGLRIVNEKWFDDGTTGGKKVFVDENGKYWESTHMTKESCGTGDTVGEMRNGFIYY